MVNLSKKITHKDSIHNLKGKIYQLELQNYHLLQLLKGVKKDILGIYTEEDKDKDN